MQRQTRAERLARKKAYYQRNLDHCLAYKKQYYEENKPKILADRADRRSEKTDLVRAQNRESLRRRYAEDRGGIKGKIRRNKRIRRLRDEIGFQPPDWLIALQITHLEMKHQLKQNSR
jgi:hypothetical protein